MSTVRKMADVLVIFRSDLEETFELGTRLGQSISQCDVSQSAELIIFFATFYPFAGQISNA
jgi:hypothetical protein